MRSLEQRKIAKVLLFALIPVFIVVGCDSSGSNNENEDKAEVSLTLSNTGQSSFPGDPSQVTIRAWTTNGENRVLRTVEFPQEGEDREVNVFIPPGNLFVGIMAHDDNGIVSFAAVTDQAQNLVAGQSTNINLEGELNFWKFDYGLAGGSLSVGENIFFQTKERLSIQKAEQLVEGEVNPFAGNNQTGTVAYDSVPFASISEAEFDAEIEAKEAVEDSIRRATGGTNDQFRIENESLLNSMYIRVELPVESEWGDEPSSIIRPHPDSSALRLKDITSDTGITFSEEK
ncbi:hypothetical protein GGP50_003297 [Salinibacter ruber]|uniref:hypothetical protein n=2 Tax=Salinibacter ruber TaxID=146919 RepID=UPI00216A65D5|nr:hypothetical protein [Salinibacter ruber]MCS4195060.1 hypothetical protein [Salinibacter ruber]